MVAQDVVELAAPVGKERKALGDGAVQRPLDLRGEAAVTAPGRQDQLPAVGDGRADVLKVVLQHAGPRRLQPAAKAPLAGRGLGLGVHRQPVLRELPAVQTGQVVDQYCPAFTIVHLRHGIFLLSVFLQI